MKRRFSKYIGIDYAGGKDPVRTNKGLRVFVAVDGREPSEEMAQGSQYGSQVYWSRSLLAEWILGQLREEEKVVVGIDHAFSYPSDYVRRFSSWDGFLEHFEEIWPTRERSVQELLGQGVREEVGRRLRLTDEWSSSAKSVFDRSGKGDVFFSTRAGIPWIRWIREQVGHNVHFWPFDGFELPRGKSVVAEVYPSIFSKRYSYPSEYNQHQRDAYAVCRWLRDRDHYGKLVGHFRPPLLPDEESQALLEGWILGICC